MYNFTHILRGKDFPHWYWREQLHEIESVYKTTSGDTIMLTMDKKMKYRPITPKGLSAKFVATAKHIKTGSNLEITKAGISGNFNN